jgi:ATP-dependent DNA helicase RecG
MPLNIQYIPNIAPFQNAKEGNLFYGSGKIISKQKTPNYHRKGKFLLYTVNVIVQDDLTSNTINLKWFNSYSSIYKKIEGMKHIYFQGEVTTFQKKQQIINPIFETTPIKESGKKYIIKYPTINSVSGKTIENIIDRIPSKLWNSIPESIPTEILEKRSLITNQSAFSTIHGRSKSIDNLKKSKTRLIYEEFLLEQIRLHFRKKNMTRLPSPVINCSSTEIKNTVSLFPYQLTKGQEEAINDITIDLSSQIPMMRLLQGDVGCGKTSVALVSSVVTMKKGYQVAIMCPTEALAHQHFNTFYTILKNTPYKISLLLGSTKSKEKSNILDQLKNNQVNLIIGTHSLIQKNIQFYNLALAIIDEQHKFGVGQRIELVNKNKGCNCLIMTATPIPRSLRLTQFGDLDISSITTTPKGRKGTQTKIIRPDIFQKFLTFLNTRLSINEQAYIVVPVINENDNTNLMYVNQVLEKFTQLFPTRKIATMHGQLNSIEKESIFTNFKKQEIDILIATSVIEVGIDVHNASIMAIMNPERFGLSAIHQLRGRVGRGQKPGFCFLICDNQVSESSLKRLKVIEQNTNGFKIAEEDLISRGEGNLFGTSQSGSSSYRKIGNIITDQKLLISAREDFLDLVDSNQSFINSNFKNIANQEFVSKTI